MNIMFSIGNLAARTRPLWPPKKNELAGVVVHVSNRSSESELATRQFLHSPSRSFSSSRQPTKMHVARSSASKHSSATQSRKSSVS
jgi:hypothetical protein